MKSFDAIFEIKKVLLKISQVTLEMVVQLVTCHTTSH